MDNQAKSSGRPRVRELTSATNSLVKVFRRALADGVTSEGWLAAEGPHILEEAVKRGARATVHSVLVSQTAQEKQRSLLAQLARETELAIIPDRLFHQISQTQAPQGIAALIELHPVELESILARRDAILVVACGLQDPGNLGAIIRSAGALGATAVITLVNTVNPFNPKAVRSCAGAVLRLPVLANLQPDGLFKHLRASGIKIIAADSHASQAISKADLTGPLAVLVGREAAGLDPEIQRQANLLLRIPIRAEADSINAATAAGIFLYELARQRGFRYKP
jgi:RNA methyltransferase, TrmH family